MGDIDKKKYVELLQEIASTQNPQDMANHVLNCQSCNILLMSADITINNHMKEKDERNDEAQYY